MKTIYLKTAPRAEVVNWYRGGMDRRKKLECGSQTTH